VTNLLERTVVVTARASLPRCTPAYDPPRRVRSGTGTVATEIVPVVGVTSDWANLHIRIVEVWQSVYMDCRAVGLRPRLAQSELTKRIYACESCQSRFQREEFTVGDFPRIPDAPLRMSAGRREMTVLSCAVFIPGARKAWWMVASAAALWTVSSKQQRAAALALFPLC